MDSPMCIALSLALSAPYRKPAAETPDVIGSYPDSASHHTDHTATCLGTQPFSNPNIDPTYKSTTASLKRSRCMVSLCAGPGQRKRSPRGTMANFLSYAP